ncbi:MAG: CTP synthase [Candidatus Spechtbacterales bacterium]|nr:CTP synthase [Candidatus Spechtbacterales bacterium]
MSRYIFVLGGVMSGVGKGVATSSIGALLKARGFNITAVKIDPYLNVDAGTMNPIEHGEVFVTNDGIESDQDLGNYERFLDVDMSSVNYMTTGRVYSEVIRKERNLEYGGKTVEVVPHITDEVTRRLKRAGEESGADFVMVEIGGTVGEYQNAIFLEAARMMHLRRPDNILFVLVTYLPKPDMIGEMKTKPTQHAVRTLNSEGIQPDIIIARSEEPLDEPRKRKISTFCNIEEHKIISAPDIQTSIYEVPLNFEKENIAKTVLNEFGMRERAADLNQWNKLADKISSSVENGKNGGKKIHIGVVGKYFETGNFVLSDAYISVIEAIKHAAWEQNVSFELEWLNASDYENKNKIKALKNYNGIIVPGGFGERGIEGKINVIEYCRNNNVPYLGLCYGMQLATVEFARNVCGLDAHTTEVQRDAKHPVIDVMPEQKVNLRRKDFGATMRLGAYTCKLKTGSIAHKAYNRQSTISERHRHRYELNNAYREQLEAAGLVVSGENTQKGLVEIIELKDHPFFMGTQFHPELKSRPFNPHPLFAEFIKTLK